MVCIRGVGRRNELADAHELLEFKESGVVLAGGDAVGHSCQSKLFVDAVNGRTKI